MKKKIIIIAVIAAAVITAAVVLCINLFGSSGKGIDNTPESKVSGGSKTLVA